MGLIVSNKRPERHLVKVAASGPLRCPTFLSIVVLEEWDRKNQSRAARLSQQQRRDVNFSWPDFWGESATTAACNLITSRSARFTLSWFVVLKRELENNKSKNAVQLLLSILGFTANSLFNTTSKEQIRQVLKLEEATKWITTTLRCLAYCSFPPPLYF